MWWLELILILIVAYLAWRQSRLEQKVEMLEKLYNELADKFDELD